VFTVRKSYTEKWEEDGRAAFSLRCLDDGKRRIEGERARDGERFSVGLRA
jgi:hypothetical protein